MGPANSSESRMREVSRGVRVYWDLWGRVARAHRELGDGECAESPQLSDIIIPLYCEPAPFSTLRARL